MKQLCSAFFILLAAVLSCGSLLAATPASTTQATFTSVSGKVQIKASKGNKTRTAQKDSTVVEGESVITDKNSKATLQLFDGSQLDISPNTNFQLTKLQKPSVQDKIMRFKLFVGQLFASVKKLASAKSSFEVEAGGVVCGVRGTKFSLDFNPGKSKVDLSVFEGSVNANSEGKNHIINAGQSIEFIGGNPKRNLGNNGKSGSNNEGNNNNGQGGNGNLALGDLNQQFGNTLSVNGDNTFTNPNVEGSLHLNVHLYVPVAEGVP